MNLGQIFQSMSVWNKLASVPMKPMIAYKILQYTKKVNAEFEIVEKQRVALIHEITGTKEGENTKIEPNTPEFDLYLERINEILLVESDLEKLDINFEEVLGSLKEDVLTVQDLALLEPFFVS
jgi:hypothetical protein